MGSGSEHGAVARALLWVAVGAALAVAALIAITPELAVDEPSRLLELLGIVLIAAIPGLLLLAFAAYRRARLRLDDEDH